METAFSAEELLKKAGDGVVVVGRDGRGRDGRIVYWNAAAERIFGFTQAEALGQSLDLIIPERHRAVHWAGYDAVMKSGKTRYGEQVLRVPALHKQGRPLSIAFTVALLAAPSGEVGGIAAIVRDESERWAEERALRRRVAELESR